MKCCPAALASQSPADREKVPEHQSMLKLISASLVRNHFSETRYFRIHQSAPPFVPINGWRAPRGVHAFRQGVEFSEGLDPVAE
jgi:hypothetical protein